jgi:hypothetical protein
MRYNPENRRASIVRLADTESVQPCHLPSYRSRRPLCLSRNSDFSRASSYPANARGASTREVIVHTEASRSFKSAVEGSGRGWPRTPRPAVAGPFHKGGTGLARPPGDHPPDRECADAPSGGAPIAVMPRRTEPRRTLWNRRISPASPPCSCRPCTGRRVPAEHRRAWQRASRRRHLIWMVRGLASSTFGKVNESTPSRNSAPILF